MDQSVSYLEPFHCLRVLVCFDLAGYQELGCGGSYLLGRGNELLLASVALDSCVGCFTQIVGGRSHHTGLVGTE